MHTGDLGRLGAEGFLYIVDRKHDMIIIGAENVLAASEAREAMAPIPGGFRP